MSNTDHTTVECANWQSGAASCVLLIPTSRLTHGRKPPGHAGSIPASTSFLRRRREVVSRWRSLVRIQPSLPITGTQRAPCGVQLVRLRAYRVCAGSSPAPCAFFRGTKKPARKRAFPCAMRRNCEIKSGPGVWRSEACWLKRDSTVEMHTLCATPGTGFSTQKRDQSTASRNAICSAAAGICPWGAGTLRHSQSVLTPVPLDPKVGHASG